MTFQFKQEIKFQKFCTYIVWIHCFHKNGVQDDPRLEVETESKEKNQSYPETSSLQILRFFTLFFFYVLKLGEDFRGNVELTQFVFNEIIQVSLWEHSKPLQSIQLLVSHRVVELRNHFVLQCFFHSHLTTHFLKIGKSTAVVLNENRNLH